MRRAREPTHEELLTAWRRYEEEMDRFEERMRIEGRSAEPPPSPPAPWDEPILMGGGNFGIALVIVGLAFLLFAIAVRLQK